MQPVCFRKKRPLTNMDFYICLQHLHREGPHTLPARSSDGSLLSHHSACCRLASSSAPMSGVAFLRYLAAAATLVAVAHGQTTSALNGQHGSSFPGACPIDKFSDVIVTTVATLPESTTGPLTVRTCLCSTMYQAAFARDRVIA